MKKQKFVKGQWLPMRGCLDDTGEDYVVLRVGHGISITESELNRVVRFLRIPFIDDNEFVKDVNKLNKADGFPAVNKSFRYSEVKSILGNKGV